MGEKKGCRRNAMYAGLGCFGLIVLAVLVSGTALVGSWMSYSDRGAPEPEETRRTVVLTPDSGQLGGYRAGGRAHPLGVTRLNIEMFGGSFEVVPGPPGSDVTVEGTYAANYYELVEERTDAGELGREISIHFRPTASVLTRALAGLQNHDGSHPNQLTVTVPRDTPIALKLRLEEGVSHSELGGLMLTDLDLTVSKGSHRVAVSEPVLGDLGHVSLTATMGDSRLEGLGNLGFESLEVTTRMGSHRLDLRGDWPAGARRQASLSHKMGDLTLVLSHAVRITEESSTTAIFGGAPSLGGRDETDDPDAPEITIDAAITMGGLNLVRRSD